MKEKITQFINEILPNTPSKLFAGISLVSALSIAPAYLYNKNKQDQIDWAFEKAKTEVMASVKTLTAASIGSKTYKLGTKPDVNSADDLKELINQNSISNLSTFATDFSALISTIDSDVKGGTFDANKAVLAQEMFQNEAIPKLKEYKEEHNVEHDLSGLEKTLQELKADLNNMPDLEKTESHAALILLITSVLFLIGAIIAANKDKIKAWKERKSEEKETETENQESTENDTENDEESEPTPLTAREIWEQSANIESDPDSMEINKKIASIFKTMDIFEEEIRRIQMGEDLRKESEKKIIRNKLFSMLEKVKSIPGYNLKPYQLKIINDQIETLNIMIEAMNKILLKFISS